MILRDCVYGYVDGWFGMLFSLFDALNFYGFYFETYKSLTYSFFTKWLVFIELLSLKSFTESDPSLIVFIMTV